MRERWAVWIVPPVVTVRGYNGSGVMLNTLGQLGCAVPLENSDLVAEFIDRIGHSQVLAVACELQRDGAASAPSLIPRVSNGCLIRCYNHIPSGHVLKVIGPRLSYLRAALATT